MHGRVLICYAVSYDYEHSSGSHSNVMVIRLLWLVHSLQQGGYVIASMLYLLSHGVGAGAGESGPGRLAGRA